jgi:hypothetical protein
MENSQTRQIQRQRNALPKVSVVNVVPRGNKGAVKVNNVPDTKPLKIGALYGR